MLSATGGTAGCIVAAHKALVTQLLFILTRCLRLVVPEEAAAAAAPVDYGATALYTQPWHRGGRWRRGSGGDFHGGGGPAAWPTVGARTGARCAWLQARHAM